MKSQSKPSAIQLHLALNHSEPAELPAGKQGELTQALAELLLRAASESLGFTAPEKGGDDESEAEC